MKNNLEKIKMLDKIWKDFINMSIEEKKEFFSSRKEYNEHKEKLYVHLNAIKALLQKEPNNPMFDLGYLDK
jgi:hypothetical protein